ncbi:MAG: M20/M25/M40 family metallo-hydrolase, partial [Alphaproteobacteria bacterium]|nr:M20/M25/M40 family metallo-hydrolase [Alphaproteobacteria bacterium]
MDPLPLAMELMRCPSVTPQDAGAQKVLAAVLESLGFTCTHLPFEGDGGDPVDNLYARIGSGGPFLCFAGHTDVVPPGDAAAWCVPPFAPEVREGFLYGRGAEDMKAAIACMVAAVASIRD